MKWRRRVTLTTGSFTRLSCSSMSTSPVVEKLRHLASLTGSSSWSYSMAFLLSFSVMVGALISVAAALVNRAVAVASSSFCTVLISPIGPDGEADQNELY